VWAGFENLKKPNVGLCELAEASVYDVQPGNSHYGNVLLGSTKIY
jgi:hypothetical protein